MKIYLNIFFNAFFMIFAIMILFGIIIAIQTIKIKKGLSGLLKILEKEQVKIEKGESIYKNSLIIVFIILFFSLSVMFLYPMFDDSIRTSSNVVIGIIIIVVITTKLIGPIKNIFIKRKIKLMRNTNDGLPK